MLPLPAGFPERQVLTLGSGTGEGWFALRPGPSPARELGGSDTVVSAGQAPDLAQLLGRE